MADMSVERMPYFVWAQNKEWYKITKEFKVILTDKAPLKARISYQKWKEKFGE